MAFQTKQGKALEAMFDESIKNEITNPNARAKPGADGTFNPYDCTAVGLLYHGDDDERFVKGGPLEK